MSSGFPLVIGHRGARGLFPENTQRGFEAALALGVDELELDLVVSGDGQLLVSHEAWMNPDICSGPDGQPVGPGARQRYNLFQMPYHEIVGFDCGSRGNPAFPLQKKLPSVKPLFGSLLESMDLFAAQHGYPLPQYLVEIKCGEDPDGAFNPPPAEFARLVYALLESRSMLQRCRLQSFDPRVLNELHKLYPAMDMALLVENRLDIKRDLARLNTKVRVYSPDYTLLTPDLVGQCHELALAVIPWTVNETQDMERLIHMGVDGLITDYPDRLMKLKHTLAK